MMAEDDIRRIVKAVFEEETERHSLTVDDVALRAVATILTSFGIDEEDRKELRADFVHLRRWRKSVEQTQGFAMKAAVTVIVGGFLGALWMGIKAMLGK